MSEEDILPAHEVVASTDVVVEHSNLQLVGLVVVHVQVELFQPARIQRLRLVLRQSQHNLTHDPSS